jgi:hypothetical protein
MSGTGDVGRANGEPGESDPAEGAADEQTPADDGVPGGGGAAGGAGEPVSDGVPGGGAAAGGAGEPVSDGVPGGGAAAGGADEPVSDGVPGGGAAAGGGESVAAGAAAGESSEAAGPEAAGGGGGSAGGASAAAAAPGPADPGELLGEVRAVRRRARLARHAYWFPLALFGLLIGASVPFYLPPTGSGVYYGPPGPRFLQSAYLGGFGIASYRGTAYYWLGAMLLGIAATVFWYRWRGNRVGLRTPARGYLLTGLIIVALALLIPLAGRSGGVRMLLIMPGDLLIRGTFPFVLIGLGLCFLAWAERSAGLAVIATVYLAVALVASLYDIENVFYNWFGVKGLGATASALPNVLLPALVLLLSGAGAWAVQRRTRPPAEPEAAEG